MNIEKIRKQAEKELAHERYREAVDKYKEKLRNQRSLWDRLFPFRIIIIKKESVNV